jgi:hypothetical protein
MKNINSAFYCCFCGGTDDQFNPLIVGSVIPGTSEIACICLECAEQAYFYGVSLKGKCNEHKDL